jgi:glycosyltransferase involved in cell wall biosynthesis
MKLKILHIVPIFHGGVGVVTSNLTKALFREGAEVVVASPAKPPIELLRLNITYYHLRPPLLGEPLYTIQFYTLNINAIKDIVKKEKPDIILTHGPLIIMAKSIHSIPIISVVHGTYANEVKWMWNHPIFGDERVKYILGIRTIYKFDTTLYRLFTKPDNVYLVAVSRNTRRELIEAGALPIKVFSVLNGVDKEVFKPMNKDYAKTLVEEILKVRLRDKVLLHVNPGPRKGTHILIRATAILRKIYGDNFTLLIAGKVGSKTYREYIENMIRGLKLEENIKMLGYVEQRVLPLLYNAADITIVPSYSEGGPLTTPESLACGTPVIATNVGGNPEYLKIVHLDSLLVRIRDYDFSVTLANKMFIALQEEWNVNIDLVPSWNSNSQIYINILKELSKLVYRNK